MLRGTAARKLDGERTSDAAEGGAMTRKTMGGSTDGTIARIGGAAAKAQRRAKWRTKWRMVAKGGTMTTKAVRRQTKRRGVINFIIRISCTRT